MTEEHKDKARLRAWVEQHFHMYGLADEEVADFRPLPSENFNEGFNAGINVARYHQWTSVEDAPSGIHKNFLICGTDGDIEEPTSYLAFAWYDGENFLNVNTGAIYHPNYYLPIPPITNKAKE